jgi:hypothetical protein
LAPGSFEQPSRPIRCESGAPNSRQDPTPTFAVAGPQPTAQKRFINFIDQLPAVDGYLPPWHLWWPPGTLERLLPDNEERALLIEEVPRLPRSFYDGAIDLPTRWWTRPAAFPRVAP